MATSWNDSSDYVARFKVLEGASVSIVAPPVPPPVSVEQRLQELGLRWSQLTPHAKHAVLWDTGIVLATVASVDTYLQVYVPCGVSMSAIAVSYEAFSKIQPTTSCTGPGGASYARQSTVASFAAVDRIAKCAISDTQLAKANSTSAVYSQDALQPSDVPSPRVFLHRDEVGATRPAIHTFAEADLTGSSASCPLASLSAGLTIPCESRSSQATNSTNTCLPAPSAAMTTWLVAIKSSAVQSSSPVKASGGLSAPTIGAIAGGCVGIVAVTLGLCFFRRWKRSQRLRTQFVPEAPPYTSMPPANNHSISNVQNGDAVRPYRKASATAAGVSSSLLKAANLDRPSHLSSLAMNPFLLPSQAVDELDPTNALAKLDQIPAHLRLPFDSISCSELLAMGVRSEVYYGRYNHKMAVAVKVITLDNVHDQDIVEAFAEEIRLMATFRHPNIVALIGYAWDKTLGSLSAVTEYLSQGNLSHFLAENAGLEWDQKASLALDVARALQYLHGLLQPMVIHRDLKSKNILLDWPSAKLSGFGVSRETMDDETMTAGVGSAFYMAPEALRSGYYSVSADMYSFGCVLCELDTQRPLYSELAVPSKRIMYFILEEGLVPSVSPACPAAIRALAEQCFNPDPTLRPTAFDVARDLDMIVNGSGDVGGGLV